MCTMALEAVTLCSLMGYRVVYTEHSNFGMSSPTDINLNALERFVLSLADTVGAPQPRPSAPPRHRRPSFPPPPPPPRTTHLTPFPGHAAELRTPHPRQVVTVSHTSKENVALRCHLDPSLVYVIPNAIDPTQVELPPHALSTHPPGTTPLAHTPSTRP